MKTISLKLPEDLSRRLERAARARGESKSAVARAALEAYLRGERAEQSFLSALELAGDLVGCVEGAGDLSTNPKYMDDLGR